jgi:co-chaperonin GroES (HSP10)
MKAQNGYLILEIPQKETETKSGILLPIVGSDGLNDSGSTATAKICAIPDSSTYQVGQLVVFNKYVPIIFEFEEKAYIAVKDTEIIAIV